MKATNRYRSGAKNPHQQVLVTPLEDGRYAISIFDTAHLRLLHKVIGEEVLTKSQEEDKIQLRP